MGLTNRRGPDESQRARRSSEVRVEFTSDILSALLDAVPDALVGIAEDGEIVLVNASAERLFGYTRDEMLGASIDVLVPEGISPLYSAQPLDVDGGTRAGRLGIGEVFSGRRKDGSEFQAEIETSPVETPAGRVTLAAVRDISGRAGTQHGPGGPVGQAESQRHDSLGEVVGGLAHDLNNMLSVILNYAGVVVHLLGQPDLTPEDIAGARRDLGQVTLAAEQAAVLTHQLLAFARHAPRPPVALSLNETVQRLEPLLRRALGGDSHLEVSLASELPLIEADPGRVDRILVELVLYVRDGLARGRTLLIETDVIEADPAGVTGQALLRDRTHVRLRVGDRGGGAPATGLEAPNMLADERQATGRGSGLATTYDIVTAAGGVVRPDPLEGAGTTVTILFPAAQEGPLPMEDPHPPRGTGDAGGGGTTA